jgi:predicted 2-oxoglutarate/Fe(II)-dependent dioxygenase YbiX
MIVRIDNFINQEQCINLINYFNNNLNNTKKYRDTITLSHKDYYIFHKLQTLFNFQDFSNTDNMEIVLWNAGSKMDLHTDNGDKLSFIIYLNDDYVGGETIIDDITVKPRTGRLILFSNGYYLHKVNEVKTNKRYTLIGWYK